MSIDFFAYGSLMVEEIMVAVSAGSYANSPAVLRDYRRRTIRHQVYPGIMPHKGAVVTGVVYFDLSRAAWERLDRFEGRMYRRDTVAVEFSDKRIAKAQTYVVRSAFAHMLSRSEWSLEAFLRAGKRQFERKYPGFAVLASAEGVKKKS